MGSQHPDVIDFAGDYNLTNIVLQNHATQALTLMVQRVASTYNQ